jgi:hypothetical protein
MVNSVLPVVLWLSIPQLTIALQATAVMFPPPLPFFARADDDGVLSLDEFKKLW